MTLPSLKDILSRCAILALAANTVSHAEGMPAQNTVSPTAYRLDLTLDPNLPRFRGHVAIDIVLTEPSLTVTLNGRGLSVSKAVVVQQGRTQTAEYREIDATGAAEVRVPRTLAAGKATLVIDYDAPFHAEGGGIFRGQEGDRWYAWSQFEEDEARTAFPGFDVPRFKVPFALSVAAPEGMTVVSNAAEAGALKEGALVRHRFMATSPLPTYLVTVAVGPFDVLPGTIPPSALRAKAVPLRIVGPRGAMQAAPFALEQTRDIAARVERYVGSPYPYAKLDQIATPYTVGGMENAAAILYQQSILLPEDERSASSLSAFGMTVAHELAHQWFGDLVTPASWDDLWLNEAFANYVGYRVLGDWRPALHGGAQLAKEGFDAMRKDELSSTHRVHELTSVTGRNFFDEITYGKGGMVVAMLARYMGDDAFRAGLNLHFKRYAHGNASSNQFFASLADSVGDPRILKSLQSFVDQPGVPLVRFARDGDRIRISQSRYAVAGDPLPAEQWTIPICYRMAAQRHCVMLDSDSMSVDAPAGAVLMPNDGGSGYYRFALGDDDWRALSAQADSLSPEEALAFNDSLWSAFAAGMVSADMLVDATRKLARNPYGPAAIASGARFAELRAQGLVPDTSTQAFERFLVDLYRPILASLGEDVSPDAHPGEDAERGALRQALVRLLSAEGHDAATRGRLAMFVENGKAATLPGALRIEAEAAYLTGDPSGRVASVFARLATAKDPLEREVLGYALGEVSNASAGQWLLDHLDDSRLTALDRRHVLNGLMTDPATRKSALPWMAGHAGALLSETHSWAQQQLIALAGNACTQNEAETFERAFAPLTAADPNLALATNETLERARTCVATRTDRMKALASVFPAR